MSCKQFKKELIHSAASGAPLQGVIGDHVDACAHCRELVERERLLLATIDAGLRRRVTADVPPSLLPGFRARLTPEAATQRERVPVWSPMGALAALILGMVISQSIRRPSQGLDGEPAVVATGQLAGERLGPIGEQSGPFTERLAAKSKSLSVLKPKTRPTDPRAFLPVGQETAVSHLVDGLRQGEINGELLLAEIHDGPVQDLSISPIEVAPILIKPLDESSQEDP